MIDLKTPDGRRAHRMVEALVGMNDDTMKGLVLASTSVPVSREMFHRIYRNKKSAQALLLAGLDGGSRHA